MKNDDSEKVGRLEGRPTRICQRCGKVYQPTGNSQRWCTECRPEVKREQCRKSCIAHPREHSPLGQRFCLNCGKEYQPNGIHQKWCTECAPKMRKEVHQNCAIRRRAANPEKVRAIGRASALAHPETRKAYNLTHVEHKREVLGEWRVAHQEQFDARIKTWRLANPERIVAFRKKQKAKRRQMGWNPLNSWFSNSDGHHINENDVIYIPKTLHQSISHDHWTGRGMEQINTLAVQWMLQADNAAALADYARRVNEPELPAQVARLWN